MLRFGNKGLGTRGTLAAFLITASIRIRPEAGADPHTDRGIELLEDLPTGFLLEGFPGTGGFSSLPIDTSVLQAGTNSSISSPSLTAACPCLPASGQGTVGLSAR